MSNHYLQHHPVGQAIPHSTHAVCCSLPTLHDVIGYEEKWPETMAAVRWGYPRFVQHSYLARVAAHAAAKLGFADRGVYLLTSPAAAGELEALLKPKRCQIREEHDFRVLATDLDYETTAQVKAFLQHTGLAISSRQAEDYLIAEGLLSERFQETSIRNGAEAIAKSMLARYVATDAMFLSNCGMSAFYAAFKAARAVQRPRGRKIYLQLGWLYLDTQKILEQFLAEDETVMTVWDIYATAQIEQIFAKHGDQLAAVITEAPTNPLLQTLDIPHLSELSRQAGAVRIFDPTMSSVCNVNLLPYTDVLVTSLTKYAAHGGDVMIGACAVNPESSFFSELEAEIALNIVPPYPRDLERLAVHIQSMPDVVTTLNRNAMQLAEHLEAHPTIKRIHWAYDQRSAANYTRIATGEQCPGCMLTIELNGAMEHFYDRARIVKGPSFGTGFTMMCPFMYLAHYDWVTNPARRKQLYQLGLDPNLLRVSVGTEPIAAIIEALG